MTRQSRPPPPVFTPTPEQGSSIIERIDKIDRLLQRVGTRVEELPNIQKDVTETSKHVVALDTTLEAVRERIAKAEDKIDQGHRCIRTSTIDQLKEMQRNVSARIEAECRQSVKTLQMVTEVSGDQETLQLDVKDIHKTRREWAKVVIGLVLTIVTTAGSGVWLLSNLAQRVEYNETVQKEQYNRLQKQVESSSMRNQRAVNQELKQLRHALEQRTPARYDDLSALCSESSVGQRRLMRRQLLQLRLEVPPACREE